MRPTRRPAAGWPTRTVVLLCTCLTAASVAGAQTRGGSGPDGGLAAPEDDDDDDASAGENRAADGGVAEDAAMPTWATEPWHMEPSDGGVPTVRIMTSAGRTITVAEGLADVGWDARLEARAQDAQRLESGLRRQWVESGGVLTVAAGLGLAGLLLLLAGLGFALVSRLGLVPPSQLRGFAELPRAAPAMVVMGALLVAVSSVSVAAGSAMTAWWLLRPPAPDPLVRDALGASPRWVATEAQEVVALHNAQPYVTGHTPPPAAAGPSRTPEKAGRAKARKKRRGRGKRR